ncbi:MAG: DUF6512 family protein [Oscillospiraceae bacterium]
MKNLQAIGAVFTLLLGSLLHFSYGWSGGNVIVGAFSATNESTWEHLKLLAVPMLLFAVLEYALYGHRQENFVPVKVLAILLGMGTIVSSFYTYVGIVGQHFLWADIGTLLLGIFVSYRFSAHFLATDSFSSARAVRLGWLGLLALVLCLVVFTASPPHIGLFLDPVTHRYGRP